VDPTGVVILSAAMALPGHMCMGPTAIIRTRMDMAIIHTPMDTVIITTIAISGARLKPPRRSPIANERRNITMGQKAMAHAMLFPNPEKLKRKCTGSLLVKPDNTSAGHWKNLVSQARAVLHYSPTLAAEVREGFPLSDDGCLIGPAE
jgi:hypothetical protein